MDGIDLPVVPSNTVTAEVPQPFLIGLGGEVTDTTGHLQGIIKCPARVVPNSLQWDVSTARSASGCSSRSLAAKAFMAALAVLSFWALTIFS